MDESLREQAILSLKELGSVTRDNKLPGRPVALVELDKSAATDEIVPYLCQIPEVQELYLDVTSVTDKVLEALRVCTSLRLLNIDRTLITDDGLDNLKYVPLLEHLVLGGGITEAGLRYVAELTHLKNLIIPETLVTERGLESIGNLKSLELVIIYCEKITEKGIQYLQSLPNLGLVQLSHRIFPDDLRLSLVAQLRKQLPNCRIEY